MNKSSFNKPGSPLKLLAFELPHGERKHQLKFAFNLNRGNHKTVYDYLANGQLYEPDISHFFRRVLKEGDHVIDVGANLGFHTVLMSRLIGEQGVVHSFEPEPVNIADLKANLRLNAANNVRLHEVAVSSTQTKVRMFSSKLDGGWNTVLTGATADFVAEVDPTKNDFVENIDTNTLDALCAGRRYKIAKIDVEGYEGRVLDGANELLASGACDYWVVEYAAHCLTHFGEDQWSIRKRFHDHGYDCYVMSRFQNFPMYVPRETTVVVSNIINLLFARPGQLGRDFAENNFDAFVYGRIG